MMTVEFNPDGSLKLPGFVARKKEEDKEKLRKQRCIRIERELVSTAAPKRCVLRVTLSEALADNRFIETIYQQFSERAAVPTKIRKINEKEFEIEIGTDFKRCTDCNSLINEFRSFLEGNIIEKKGSCTFEGLRRDFCYEDYFS